MTGVKLSLQAVRGKRQLVNGTARLYIGGTFNAVR
jgi:hypothetical protein